MKLAKPKIWFVIMAALSGMGWVFLLSPWADWAPAGVRWPSVLVALIFGLSAFLSFSYYPLLAVTIIISLAFSGHSEERSKSRDHIFLNGAIFLAGFTVVFTLQSMAIIPINAHGSDGIPWGENLAAGVYVFSGIVTIIFSMKKKSSWSNGSINYPVVFKILVFLLGLGWGVYYGHDLDPDYDRMHFRVGAGPGSHEAPALILFGVGLVTLQAIWTWGIALWLGDYLDRSRVRFLAGVLLTLLGISITSGFHLP